jgi:hypothetical protein
MTDVNEILILPLRSVCISQGSMQTNWWSTSSGKLVFDPESLTLCKLVLAFTSRG